MTKTLFEPAALGGLKIEKRMVRSATWEDIAYRTVPSRTPHMRSMRSWRRAA